MSDLINRSAEILSRWFGEYDHLKNEVADPTALLHQETFTGFIDLDNWREDYDKKMQEPDIRQKVEDQIEMENGWKILQRLKEEL